MDKRAELLNSVILNTSINGILLLNDKFEIEEFNKSAERHFGYKEEEVLGKKVYFFMSEEIRNKIKEGEDEEAVLLSEGTESYVIAADGKKVPVFYSMTKFDLHGTVKYSAFFKNISWEKESERQRTVLLEKTAAREFKLSTKVEYLENILKQHNISYEPEPQTDQLIIWDNSLSIGLEEIDNQHKRWVEIINKLYSAFQKGVALDNLYVIISELSEYTEYHFGFEEEYMKKTNYEETEAHKKTHTDFIEKLQKFKEEYKEGRVDVAYNLMSYLRPWVKFHILKVDKPYAEIFRKAGL